MRYLKQHRKILYYNLLTIGELNSYIADIDKQAEDMFSRLVNQMAEREGITEKLKADNQMECVGRMNVLRSAVTETGSITYISQQKNACTSSTP